MRAVTQRVAGELLTENGRSAIILRSLEPDEDEQRLVYLRCAFVTRGPEDHIFPALLLDDWGNEIRGLKLYRWVEEYGEQFPRGEIFGFEQDGRDTQLFLRELELYARLPCYAFEELDTAVTDGHLLQAILLPSASVGAPRRTQPPDWLETPLRRARVTWWQIPAAANTFDFSLFDRPPGPGF